MSHLDETVLEAIRILGGRDYGVPIRRETSRLMNKDISVGSLYITLDDLVRQGYLTAEWGEATPERNGRRRQYFSLTNEGGIAISERIQPDRSESQYLGQCQQ